MEPPIRPLSYRFHDPTERQSTFAVTDQFMIGDAILVVPIISSDTSRNGYFPKGIWYQSDGSLAWNDTTAGGNLYLNALITTAHVFLRGGNVIPTLVQTKELQYEYN